MKIKVTDIYSPSYLDIQVNRTYNFLISKNGKLEDVRGLVTKIEKNFITIKVIEE